LLRFIHGLQRSGVRGRQPLTALLARRLPVLQAAPVQIASYPPLFVDLLNRNHHSFFASSPYRHLPRNRPVQTVMQHVVRPGDVALDVGAHRGIFLVALAAMVGPRGRVVAFEPNPALQPNLRRTVAGIPHARLLPYALSNTAGEATLHVPPVDEMACLAAGYATRSSATTMAAPCVLHRLDALVTAGEVPQPDFMKIDTEGTELLLFQGARATLDREDAPILIYESNLFAAPMVSGAAAPAATCFLAQLARPRYRFFFIWSWGALTPLLPGQYVHDNILAVPETRLNRWPELTSSDVLEI
jgi:FkbM family methyltransferase